MKTNHYQRAVPFTGVLLFVTAVSAEQDLQTYLDSTNRVTLSLRFGLNIHAKFTGIGSAAGNGHYFDGYVLTDVSDNYLGYTAYWGYENANQYSQFGNINQAPNTFTFHKPAVTGASSEPSDNDNPYLGVELAYDRQLGEKENWHNLRYGLEGAVNYMRISLNNNSSYNTDVTTDTYLFGGIPGQIPSPGHQGLFSGNPGDPVLVVPGTGTTTPGGTLLTQDHFDADLWGGRLGPYLELPFGKKQQFTLALSGGLAVGLLDANESWKETLTLPNGGGSIPISGGGSDTDLLWGYYISLNAAYQLNERWGVKVGVQFQDLGKFSHNFQGRQVELDLSRSLFVELGISYSF